MVADGRPGRAMQESVLRRALAARDPARLHVHFDAAVVNRYRALEGVQLLRTRSVGRITVPGRWSLDVGIAADGSVHVPFRDLVERLPEDEWPHWIEHLADLPSSAAFLQMRLSAGACVDDGETGPWT